MRIFKGLLLVPFVIGACATYAHAKDELKIGVMSALSGPGAAWGNAFYHGAEIAAEELNKTGGLNIGGKKHLIKMIPYDTKYQVSEALPAANRLIFGDGVKFIIGPFAASEAVATQALTSAQKVITFTFGWSPRTLGLAYPYQFRMSTTDTEFSAPQTKWISGKLKLTKVAALFPNDEFGQQSSKKVGAAYAKLGTQFNFELFERDRVDFIPLLTGLLARGIDGFELDGNSPVTAGLIVKQLRELGYNGPIVRTGGPATREIIDIAGAAAADGLYYHSPIDPSQPTMVKFGEDYRKRYGNEMNDNTPIFYDGTRILFDAISRAGTTTDTDKVVEALNQVRDFQGIVGTINWGGKEVYGINRQIQAPFFIVQLTNGKKVPVAKCNWTVCEDIRN